MVAGGFACAALGQQIQTEDWRSLVWSKTDMLNTVDEFLRSWLIMFSKELNACDVLEIFSPSRFTSHATCLGLRERCAVDLTTANWNEHCGTSSVKRPEPNFDGCTASRVSKASRWKLALSRMFFVVSLALDPRRCGNEKEGQGEPHLTTSVEAHKLQMKLEKLHECCELGCA